MDRPTGPYRLPKLPYSVQAFGEFLSRESFAYHYDKHHRAYLDSLNQLIRGTPKEKESLEEIVRASSEGESKLFNQASQAWNHAFYWYSMTPEAKRPSARLRELVDRSFGSIEELGRQWVEKGVAQFGSGWVWLVENEEKRLSVATTSNAGNPALLGQKPIACCDAWEHAYYIDHRNDRAKFLTRWLSHLDWDFAEENLDAPDMPAMGATMRGP